jgi:hypothetical protein
VVKPPLVNLKQVDGFLKIGKKINNNIRMDDYNFRLFVNKALRNNLRKFPIFKIYIMLLNESDDNFECEMSYLDLSKKYNITKTEIGNGIKHLKQIGAIEVLIVPKKGQCGRYKISKKSWDKDLFPIAANRKDKDVAELGRMIYYKFFDYWENAVLAPRDKNIRKLSINKFVKNEADKKKEEILSMIEFFIMSTIGLKSTWGKEYIETLYYCLIKLSHLKAYKFDFICDLKLLLKFTHVKNLSRILDAWCNFIGNRPEYLGGQFRVKLSNYINYQKET